MMIWEMIMALRKKGFSEEAIAYGAQVHKSTISRILSGKIACPRYCISHRIEQLFMNYCN
jgi:lambda repressor-like predicted transcriptional regulator